MTQDRFHYHFDNVFGSRISALSNPKVQINIGSGGFELLSCHDAIGYSPTVKFPTEVLSGRKMAQKLVLVGSCKEVRAEI